MSGNRGGNLRRALSTTKSLGTLVGSKTIIDRLGGRNFQDVYRFGLQQSSSYSITLKNLNPKTTVRLADQSGRTLYRTANGRARSIQFSRPMLSAGSYALQIKSHHPQPAPYRLNLAIVAQPIPSPTPAPIPVPAPTPVMPPAPQPSPIPAPTPSYQTYTFRYRYGNGDFYDGFGEAAAGTYEFGQVISKGLNETGLQGAYQITGVTSHAGTSLLLNQVTVLQYFDQESGMSKPPASGWGSNGLGSESGQINSGETNTIYNAYAEADIEFQEYTFQYSYGNGDFYTGYGYARGGSYLPGQTLKDSKPNETGLIGAYQILTVKNQPGTSAELRKVFVNRYYDSEMKRTFVPASGEGTQALGSEAGYLIPSDGGTYFGKRYSEADLLPGQLPPASLTLTSFNGGSFTPGSTETIQWTGNTSGEVKLELLKGNQVVNVITDSTPNTGYFSWTLPNQLVSSNDYKIQITSLSDAVSDSSDVAFTIQSAAASTFNIEFDYRFDTGGWFTAARRSALEAAAEVWERIIRDEFKEVPIGTQTPYVTNPQTGQTIDLFTTDRPIDDLLIFVGSRSMSSGVLALGGASGFYTTEPRYTGSDFEPWIGSIAFNTNANWFFDATPATTTDIPIEKFDFISTAVHEMGHVLGFSRGSIAFDQFLSGDTFAGANARARTGGNGIPLQSGGSHIRDGYEFGGSGESVMDPTSASGARQLPTVLDIAILDDIGYSVNYSAATNNLSSNQRSLPGRAYAQCGCASCMVGSSVPTTGWIGQADLSALVSEL